MQYNPLQYSLLGRCIPGKIVPIKDGRGSSFYLLPPDLTGEGYEELYNSAYMGAYLEEYDGAEHISLIDIYNGSLLPGWKICFGSSIDGEMLERWNNGNLKEDDIHTSGFENETSFALSMVHKPTGISVRAHSSEYPSHLGKHEIGRLMRSDLEKRLGENVAKFISQKQLAISGRKVNNDDNQRLEE